MRRLFLFFCKKTFCGGISAVEEKSREVNETGILLLLAAMCGLSALFYVYGRALRLLGGAEYKSGVAENVGLALSRAVKQGGLGAVETTALVVSVAVVLLAAAGCCFGAVQARKRVMAFWDARMIGQRKASLKGSARWGSAAEAGKLLSGDGLILGYQGLPRRPVRLSLKASFEHLAVVGPTGSGKTSSFFIPNILDLRAECSLVVTDPKGEIEERTRRSLEAKGYRVYTFNLEKPEKSVVYNPLALARDDTEVSDMAEIILRNGYSAGEGASDTQWIYFSLPLFESVLLLERELKKRSGGVPTIRDACGYITNYTDEDRVSLFRGMPENILDKYLAFAQSLQSPETASSIKTVAISSTRIFTRPDVAGATGGGKMFRPELLRKEKCAFFIQVKEHKAHLYKPLMATLYWQLMEHLTSIDGLPVVFLLDEFPNLGKIPGFAQMAATLRSRKISLCIGLQGVEQLSREYTAEEQQDILNNMKTKIFYPGLSGQTGKYFEQVAGYSTVKNRGAEERRELLTADELRRLPDGKVVVVVHNLQPIILDAVPYFKNPALAGGAA